MGGPVRCVRLRGSVQKGACARCGLAAFREICAGRPLPLFSTHLPHPTSEFIFSLQQKEGPSWPFIFQFRAFLFFADKCSPIHPDRCHIASLPFWYIASDPATCNKEPAPGTPLPRHRSDTGDYFKGASLVVLSAETLTGLCVHVRSPLCSLQEPGYGLVSGSGNDNSVTHWVVVTSYPDTAHDFWQRFMLLSDAFPSFSQSLRCDFTGQSWRNNLYKGKVLVLLLPAETHCTVALIIQGQSTSVNTVCQVKVKIRSHSI